MPAQKLSCYLFNETYTDIEKVINKEEFREKGYDKLDLVEETLNEIVEGYLCREKENTPDWVKKLQEIFVLDDLKNRSNSLIFFVKTENRIFAFTNGYSRSVVDFGKIEWDFGVKIALNELDENDIGAIDSRKISASPHQKKETSSSGSRLYDFEFDSNEEFINSISGKLESSKIAKILIGKESLKVNINLDLRKIEAYCKELLKTYKKDNYKKHYPFYDKIKIIKDSNVYDKFIEELKSKITKKEFDNLVINYPNINDFDCLNYRFSYERKTEEYCEINLNLIDEFLSKYDIEVSDIDFKKLKVKLINNDGNIEKEYSILDYLVLEFEYGDNNYIYTNTQIFQIEKDYYDKLISDIAEYEINDIDDIDIPKIHYKYGKNKKQKTVMIVEREDEYNERFASLNPTNVLCLDKDNFRDFPERPNDQVEICDIITKNKELICIKIFKSSSAPMSHLFQQGYVSAELLAVEQKYREKLLESVKDKFGDSYIDTRNIDRTEIKYIYAIGMKNSGSLAYNLPFFSKISLRQNIKDLKKLNFELKIIKIDLEQNS